MDHISPELLGAYLRTDYRVITPNDPGNKVKILKVDQPSDFLAQVLKMHMATQSAFITACNPLSEQLDEASNRERTEQLKNEIKERWRRYEAEGADPLGQWPPEASFLIVGIEIDDAVMLARKYKQKAFLHSDYLCDREAIPRLVFPLDDGYFMRNNPLQRMHEELIADWEAKGIKVNRTEPQDFGTLTATFVPRRDPALESVPQSDETASIERDLDGEALFKLISKPGEIFDDDWFEEAQELIWAEGIVVGLKNWDSGGPGAGAGTVEVRLFRGAFFASDDEGIFGPYKTFAAAAKVVGLMVRNAATKRIWVADEYSS